MRAAGGLIAAGPIVALYLLPQHLDRQAFVGTCAVFFFMLNTAKLPSYAVAGMFKEASPWFAMQFLPLVVAGAVFGRWLTKRMSDAVFARILYAATFVLGRYLLVEGMYRLR